MLQANTSPYMSSYLWLLIILWLIVQIPIPILLSLNQVISPFNMTDADKKYLTQVNLVDSIGMLIELGPDTLIQCNDSH